MSCYPPLLLPEFSGSAPVWWFTLTIVVFICQNIYTEFKDVVTNESGYESKSVPSSASKGKIANGMEKSEFLRPVFRYKLLMVLSSLHIDLPPLQILKSGEFVFYTHYPFFPSTYPLPTLPSPDSPPNPRGPDTRSTCWHTKIHPVPNRFNMNFIYFTSWSVTASPSTSEIPPFHLPEAWKGTLFGWNLPV